MAELGCPVCEMDFSVRQDNIHKKRNQWVAMMAGLLCVFISFLLHGTIPELQVKSFEEKSQMCRFLSVSIVENFFFF